MTVLHVQAEGTQVAPGDDALIPVPSGQAVTLQEVVWNAPGAQGLTLRFRFIAPGIAPGAGVAFDAAIADMQALCDTFALPRMAEFGPQVQQVVISLAAAPLTFGETAPEITQFFEAYRVEDGTCIWEIY